MKELLNQMTTVDWIIFGVAVGSFIPLFIETYKKKGEGQSSTTWILWCILDTLQMFATIRAKGVWVTLCGFAIGSLCMVAFLLYYKMIELKKFDLIICVTTGLCAIYWLDQGDLEGIIAFTGAQLIASIPLARSVWKKPYLQQISLFAYIGFLIVNLLTLYQAPAWTWAYILYPAIFTIFEFMIIMFIVRSRVQRKVKVFYY